MAAPTNAIGSRDAGLTLAALLSALAIPAAPGMVVLTFLAEHVASFHGTCGPYPTDIPAFPCGFGEYLVNFAEPFALAGLIALSVVAATVVAAALALGWSLAGVVWLLARGRS